MGTGDKAIPGCGKVMGSQYSHRVMFCNLHGIGLLVCAYPVCMYFFFFLRATPAAYRGSQARGRTGAAAAGLHHSHSNARS